MRQRLRFIATLLISLGFVNAAAPAQNQAAERQAAAEHFVDLLVQGRFADAVLTFDKTMLEGMPEWKMKQVWTSVTAQVGAFQKRLGARSQTAHEYEIVFVTCQFASAVLDIQLSFDAQGKVVGLFFRPGTAPANATDAANPGSAPKTEAPPPYVDTAAFADRDVEVGEGEWKLPGSLSVPAGPGPFPALVLVHGSGPEDRDETIGPNKPFRDLAWGLASRGVAVLRYEKRTKLYGSRMAAMPQLTVNEETVDDALAAVRLLAATKDVDRRRIYVLGHSLGGMLIPRIAGRAGTEPPLAGVVVLAGNTRPLEDLIVEQLAYVQSLGGAPSTPDPQIAALGEQVKKIKALDPQHPGSSELLIGAPPAYWLDLRDYHPAEAAKGLKLPMLILQGERDYQVTMTDLAGWRKALAGHANVTIKTYPDLNHLFMTGTGKATPAEYEQPGHVKETVVVDIANWIRGSR